MNAPQIPRKPVGEPAPAHVKEVDSQNATTESGWDIPDEGQKKKKYIGFGSSAGTGADAGGAKLTFSNRLDRVLSPHKRYFGRSRRTLLIVIGVAFLCLLGLIIGLAVGLSGGEKTQDLPLPGDARVHNGELTFYGTGLGACGVESTDDDIIVSVSHYTFDAAQTGSDPNQNPLCGRKIRARRMNEGTGKNISVDVTVVDRCTGCQPTDLDVSPAVFKRLADPDLGRVPVTWAWL